MKFNMMTIGMIVSLGLISWTAGANDTAAPVVEPSSQQEGAYPVDSQGQLGASRAQYNRGAIGTNKPRHFPAASQAEVAARSQCLSENGKLWGRLLDDCIARVMKK